MARIRTISSRKGSPVQAPPPKHTAPEGRRTPSIVRRWKIGSIEKAWDGMKDVMREQQGDLKRWRETQELYNEELDQANPSPPSLSLSLTLSLSLKDSFLPHTALLRTHSLTHSLPPTYYDDPSIHHPSLVTCLRYRSERDPSTPVSEHPDTATLGIVGCFCRDADEGRGKRIARCSHDDDDDDDGGSYV
jgi:hypothetical protein